MNCEHLANSSCLVAVEVNPEMKQKIKQSIILNYFLESLAKFWSPQ